MKKLLVLGGLILGFGSVSLAQEVQVERTGARQGVKREHKQRLSPEEVAKLRTNRMDAIVELTPEQRKQVYKLSLEETKKFQQGRRQAGEARKESRIAAKENQTAIESLLTPEQQKKWQDAKLAASKGQQPSRYRMSVRRDSVKSTQDKVESEGTARKGH